MKSFSAISVAAAALFSVVPANAQSSAADTEAELIGLHQLCDHGDRLACIRFGFILGSSREFQVGWRNAHPDWWAWEPRGASMAPQAANITLAPPELPVYEQPPLPVPGYLWTPGYWAYGSEGYFWVPGTWVQPPEVGVLWTPGYWGWRNGLYIWSAGYWGPHIGFYGGVNYGFGYGGVGYEGGRWNNGVFAYNQTVNNFGGVRITNVYSQTVVVNTTVRVSFNGGNGGTQARPTPQEEAASHEHHVQPTAEQTQHQQLASNNKSLLASENHGRPAIAATAKPGDFNGKGVVAAKEATPGNARPGEPGAGAKVPETSPTVARTPETGPAGEKKIETKPETAKLPEAKPETTKLPEMKPETARLPETNAPGAKTHEEKKPEGNRATLNGGAPPKPSNIETKPLVAAPPAKPMGPKPPPPHVASAPPPHPAAPPPHPAARSGPPAKDKKPPG